MANTPRGLQRRRQQRVRAEAFEIYKVLEPEKAAAGALDGLLRTFSGQEEELLARLRTAWQEHMEAKTQAMERSKMDAQRERGQSVASHAHALFEADAESYAASVVDGDSVEAPSADAETEDARLRLMSAGFGPMAAAAEHATELEDASTGPGQSTPWLVSDTATFAGTTVIGLGREENLRAPAPFPWQQATNGASSAARQRQSLPPARDSLVGASAIASFPDIGIAASVSEGGVGPSRLQERMRLRGRQRANVRRSLRRRCSLGGMGVGASQSPRQAGGSEVSRLLLAARHAEDVRTTLMRQWSRSRGSLVENGEVDEEVSGEEEQDDEEDEDEDEMDEGEEPLDEAGQAAWAAAVNDVGIEGAAAFPACPWTSDDSTGELTAGWVWYRAATDGQGGANDSSNNMANDDEAGSNNNVWQKRYATLGPANGLQLFDQKPVSCTSIASTRHLEWQDVLFSLDEEEDAGEHQQEGEQEDCDCGDSDSNGQEVEDSVSALGPISRLSAPPVETRSERGFSEASKKAFGTLNDIEAVLRDFEMQCDDAERIMRGVEPRDGDQTWQQVKSDVSQLSGQIEKLQFARIDQIHVGALNSGQEQARAQRKALNRRVDALNERVKAVHAMEPPPPPPPPMMNEVSSLPPPPPPQLAKDTTDSASTSKSITSRKTWLLNVRIRTALGKMQNITLRVFGNVACRRWAAALVAVEATRRFAAGVASGAVASGLGCVRTPPAELCGLVRCTASSDFGKKETPTTQLEVTGKRVQSSHLHALTAWSLPKREDDGDPSRGSDVDDGNLAVKTGINARMARPTRLKLWRASQRAWSMRTVDRVTLRRAGLSGSGARALCQISQAEMSANLQAAELAAEIGEINIVGVKQPPTSVVSQPRTSPFLALQALCLAHNNLHDSAVSSLSSALLPPAAPNFARLDLSFNMIGDFGAAALGAVLRRRDLEFGRANGSGQLELLDLAYNVIGVAGVRAIVSQLTFSEQPQQAAAGTSTPRAPKHLDLSFNPLGDSGAVALIPLLRLASTNGNSSQSDTVATTSRVAVRHCGICAHGANVLARTISQIIHEGSKDVVVDLRANPAVLGAGAADIKRAALAVSGDSIDEDSMDTGRANRMSSSLLVESTQTDNDDTEFVVQAAKPGSRFAYFEVVVDGFVADTSMGQIGDDDTPTTSAISDALAGLIAVSPEDITVLTTSGVGLGKTQRSTVLLLRLHAATRSMADALLRELWQKVAVNVSSLHDDNVDRNTTSFDFTARMSRARLGELRVSFLAVPPSAALTMAALARSQSASQQTIVDQLQVSDSDTDDGGDDEQDCVANEVMDGERSIEHAQLLLQYRSTWVRVAVSFHC
eukprot:g471.t1